MNIKDGFNVIDGRLVYVSDEFIATSHNISEGFEGPSRGSRESGSTSVVASVGNDEYFVTLSVGSQGPFGRTSRQEVWKRGEKLIDRGSGSVGGGRNYSRVPASGSTEEGHLLMLIYGGALSGLEGVSFPDKDSENTLHYLLKFKRIVRVRKNPEWPRSGEPLVFGRTYSQKEIEPLRQLEWSSGIKVGDKQYRIKKLAVPYCWETYSYRGKDTEEIHEYHRNDNIKTGGALVEYQAQVAWSRELRAQRIRERS